MMRLLACLSLAALASVSPAADPGPAAATNAVSYESFKVRDGLVNCRIKFEREKKGRVAFLGGSITEARFPSNAWHFAVREYLKRKFPQTEFDFIQAGIAGQGTTPHAFRFVRDVMKNGPVDLLFVEGAESALRSSRPMGFLARLQKLSIWKQNSGITICASVVKRESQQCNMDILMMRTKST